MTDRIAKEDYVDAAVAALDAGDVEFTPAGTIAATDVQAAIVEVAAEAAGGAPTGADYLVGTTQGGLSAEIVVGTSPGGELGGTWASPTVDATHSGSTHAAVQAAAEATAAGALSTHEADTTSVHGIADTSALYRASGTDVALADGGTGASLVDPNADRILFWDDSAGAFTWLAPGTNLTITATTIDAAGGTGAPTDAPYYVTTANGGLSAEVVVPAFIQTVLDDTTAVDARATLGVISSLFKTGGAQAIKLDELAATTDVTTLNASTSAHGLLPKLPNDASYLLDGLGAWKQIGWVTVVKPSDETVTSSTTLQNDDHLTFTTVVGGIYEFQVACIYTSASATPDIKFAMGDSGTTQGVGLGGPSFTTADGAQAPGFLMRSGTGAFSAGTGAGDTRIVQMDGMWRGIGTTWVFQWAQNTSDGSGVTVKAGSVVRYRRLL